MENNTETPVKEDIFLKFKKIILLNEYSLLTKIILYLVTILIFIISITLFSRSYIKHKSIALEKIQPITLQEFIDNDALIIENSTVKMLFKPEEFNQFLKASMQNLKIDSLKENKIIECQYDYSSKLVYMNVTDKKENIYSFVTKVKMEVRDNNLILVLSDYKLGQLKSRILGNYYKMSLGLPKELSLSFVNKSNILSIKAIKEVSSSEIEISYKYNYDNFISRINEYRNQTDGSKLKIYEKNVKISPEILDVFTAEKVTKDAVAKFIKTLEKNSEGLEQCSLLLNEQGIRAICSDLKKLYAKNINVDKLVEKSENELDKNINKYHRDFSKMLLSYLYNNKDFNSGNSSIQINGTTITSDRILSENNYAKIYDIDIVSDSKGISAIYKLSNKNVSKMILRKE